MSFDAAAMHREACTPFDPAAHNCGTAVLAAFGYGVAIRAVRRAWPRNARNIAEAAARAAARIQAVQATPGVAAWGVADFGGGLHVLCARDAQGPWLCRTEPQGVAIVPAQFIKQAWKV
jgi:hypothetical protein